MARLRYNSRIYTPLTLCALLALSAAAQARPQTGPQSPAQAATPSAQGPAQPPIVRQVEQEAESYQTTIAKVPIQVQQTVRYYDASGHLKKTRQSSYRYASAAAAPAPAKGKDAALNTSTGALDGATLSDGVTLPLVFLPGSIIHLSIRTETPASGPQVLHFQSTPCPSPEVLRHWLESNIVSQCVEGDAYVDPKTGAITRIRMDMAGLPLGFRSLAYPLGVVVLELYNDVTFRMAETTPGAPAQLVPQKAEYVTYTTRGRTVVDQTFELAQRAAQASAAQ